MCACTGPNGTGLSAVCVESRGQKRTWYKNRVNSSVGWLVGWLVGHLQRKDEKRTIGASCPTQSLYWADSPGQAGPGQSENCDGPRRADNVKNLPGRAAAHLHGPAPKPTSGSRVSTSRPDPQPMKCGVLLLLH